MEENKKIEFESYLESQGLDKETEEKIAKDKSERLARLQQIQADSSMSTADKIQEILSIISSKYKETQKSQALRMEHQKKIKENESTKQTLDSKRDTLQKRADMFKQLFTSLDKINKDLIKDSDAFMEEAKQQRAALKVGYEDSLKKMSDDIQQQRVKEYQEKNQYWRNKIIELSDKFKEKEKEMKEMETEPFQELTTNMTNLITQNYLQKFQNNIIGATEIEHEVKRMEDENELMKEELKLYKKKYEEVKQSMDKNDQAMRIYDDKLAEMENSKKTTQSGLTKEKKECDSLSIELITLMEEKRILMKHLEEVKMRCDKLNAPTK